MSTIGTLDNSRGLDKRITKIKGVLFARKSKNSERILSKITTRTSFMIFFRRYLNLPIPTAQEIIDFWKEWVQLETLTASRPDCVFMRTLFSLFNGQDTFNISNIKSLKMLLNGAIVTVLLEEVVHNPDNYVSTCKIKEEKRLVSDHMFFKKHYQDLAEAVQLRKRIQNNNLFI